MSTSSEEANVFKTPEQTPEQTPGENAFENVEPNGASGMPELERSSEMESPVANAPIPAIFGVTKPTAPERTPENATSLASTPNSTKNAVSSAENASSLQDEPFVATNAVVSTSTSPPAETSTSPPAETSTSPLIPTPNIRAPNTLEPAPTNASLGASSLTDFSEPPVKQNKTKRRRSTKQREADEGQKKMLEMLRGMYNKEFADIPEKFRPKPKAYVARAAYYKKEGPDRDKYIENWLLSDRTAADARMGTNVGKKRLKEQANFSNEYVLETLPSIVSNATGSSEKFHPSMDTLKERAKKAVQRMHDITDKAHDGLMKRIKQPVVRKTAAYLFKETRKLIKRLGGEINTQTRHLQKAAKDYIDRQRKGAQTSIQRKAEANLTGVLGRKPNKRLTHRLTRLRNTGKGTSVRNFLNAENKAGRLPKTLKKNWRKGLPNNTALRNDYANND